MPEVKIVKGTVSIPKKGGGSRKIVVPTTEGKTLLRSKLGRLERKAAKACPQAHGFVRARSPVTNALEHVGYRWTVNFDLEDFFNSITEKHLTGRLSKEEAELVLVDLGDGNGPRPYQGLPTSPAVANLAAVPLDQAIVRAISKRLHKPAGPTSESLVPPIPAEPVVPLALPVPQPPVEAPPVERHGDYIRVETRVMEYINVDFQVGPGDAPPVVGAPPEGGLPAVLPQVAPPQMEVPIPGAPRPLAPIVYTRYADDLTLSGNDYADRDWVLLTIPQIVSRCGFKISRKKTHVSDSRAGYREVTGVMVGDDGIHASREVRRRLRAAVHQSTHGRTELIRQKAKTSAMGLTEWCKLKHPKPLPVISEEVLQQISNDEEVAAKLAKEWHLTGLPKPLLRPQEFEVAEGDFVITRDPAYILGCSTYTTGWRSCMAMPDGQYHQGVRLWFELIGSSVAAMLSNTTVTHAGIERRAMRARCFIHRFRGVVQRDGSYSVGKIGYDRIYGDVESVLLLEEWLKSKGYEHVRNLPHQLRVLGNVEKKKLVQPYFDSLQARQMRDGAKEVWVVMTK